MPKPKAPPKRPSSSSSKTSLPIRLSSSSPSSPSTSAPVVLQLPLPLQTQILATFRTALLPAITSITNGTNKDLKSVIQEVKSHLYNRDFAAAFGRKEYLHAYALRWSAGRALGYASIFVSPELRAIFERGGSDQDGDGPERGVEGKNRKERKRIVCIGGGAGAEVVAFAAVHRYLDNPDLEFDVHAVDIADWSSVIEKLDQAWDITSTHLKPREDLSNAATKARRHDPATNQEKEADSSAQPTTDTVSPPPPSPPTPPPHPRTTFHQSDILTLSSTSLSSLLLPPSLSQPFTTTTPLILTLLFTLNELFTTSLSCTTTLLLSLTDLVPRGTVLIVIDSPGSYSEVSLGGSKSNKKKYPMRFLLDHTLLTLASSPSSSLTTPSTKDENAAPHGGGSGCCCWEKFVSDESRWFRIDERLKGNSSSSSGKNKDGGAGIRGYPVELENMRFQMHGYRRL